MHHAYNLLLIYLGNLTYTYLIWAGYSLALQTCSKVYDKVDLFTLIQKVKCVGIVGNLRSGIGTFISGRT